MPRVTDKRKNWWQAARSFLLSLFGVFDRNGTEKEIDMNLQGTANGNELVGPHDAPFNQPVWCILSGVWTGTVKVKRSYDDGATLHDLTVDGEVIGHFTANCCEEVLVETDPKGRVYLEIAVATGQLTYELRS